MGPVDPNHGTRANIARDGSGESGGPFNRLRRYVRLEFCSVSELLFL